MAGDRPKQPAH